MKVRITANVDTGSANPTTDAKQYILNLIDAPHFRVAKIELEDELTPPDVKELEKITSAVPNWSHVKRCEDIGPGEERHLTNFQHLFKYVSAYELNTANFFALHQMVNDAIIVAKRDTKPQIVDQDGEMFFVVYPSGMIALCIRWKEYEVERGT